MTELLVRVTVPHFCAGIVVRDEVVVEAAPILKWAIGKPLEEVARWALRKKGGSVEVVRRSE